MKYTQTVLFAALFCLLSLAARSGPLEASNASGQILGASGTYLPLIARSTQKNWVLIKVSPNQLSGFATLVATPYSASIQSSKSWEGLFPHSVEPILGPNKMYS